LVLVSKISLWREVYYESIFYKLKNKPSNINIVWIRDVQKPEVLCCVGLDDFYTLDNLLHAKNFLENSIACIKK
jgi:hypothetical protein